MAIKEKILRRSGQFAKEQTDRVIPEIMGIDDHDYKRCENICFPLIYQHREFFDLAYSIHDSFIEKLNPKAQLNEKTIRDVISKHLADYTLPKAGLKNEIIDFIIDNLLYYGPISTIIRNTGHDLNDILVNTKDYIDLIYSGQTIATPYRFRSEAELRRIIARMLGESNRKIDESRPIASAKLSDGSRVEVQIPPIAANLDKEGKPGSYLTIRKFREIPLLLESMIDGSQIDLKIAYFLIKAVQGKLNIVISGGTSSGKTTFLNAITRFIDEGDQLLTIEDTKEMKPQMPCHSIRSFEARTENEEGAGAITIEQLLKTALRSSPRRIIVGECRGPEIVTMLNAMNTGHPGSMTTVHADDTKEAIIRIENMFLEARPTANMNFVRTQIVSAVDLVVQLVRFPDGRRRVVKISEPEKRVEENGVVSILDIFEFRRNNKDGNIIDSGGSFGSVSTPVRSIAKMVQNGIDIEKKIFDPAFIVTKDMVISELRRYHPSIMCGWEEHFMNEIIKGSYQDGKNILERWPNLQR